MSKWNLLIRIGYPVKLNQYVSGSVRSMSAPHTVDLSEDAHRIAILQLIRKQFLGTILKAHRPGESLDRIGAD